MTLVGKELRPSSVGTKSLSHVTAWAVLDSWVLITRLDWNGLGWVVE